MDDLEVQISRLGDHRDAQLVADEDTVPVVAAESHHARRVWLVAAALSVIVGLGAAWLVVRDNSALVEVDDPAGPTVPPPVSTPPPPESTTTLEVGTRVFESRLDYAVALPADWVADETSGPEGWSGGDGGFFRASVHDHPNRDPFVDSVPKFLPTLEEAVVETAGLFPEEFGIAPVVEATTIDGRAGYVIRPSGDSLSPDTVTYIFEAPVTVPWRFIEFAVDGPHEVDIMGSLAWLPLPADWINPVIRYRRNLEGRRVLEDLFDAMAAGEWEVATNFILSASEWPGPAIAQRIGEYDPDGDSLSTRLADYCAGALCDAPFLIGGAVAGSEVTQTFEVTFESVDGPVIEQMTVGWFEAEATVNSVPPPGESARQGAPIDVRVFGEPYTGDLAVLRYEATEFLVNGTRTWSPYRWHLVSTSTGVAGGAVISESNSYGDGAVTPDNERVVLAEDPAALVGAATPDGVPLVFIVDEGRRTVSAVDPEGVDETVLFAFDGDESVTSVDASAERIVVRLESGESAALEVYEFDPATRAVGSLLARIEPEGYVGAGHLAPDGDTIAATLDPSFYAQAQTVAVLDSTDGTVLETWGVDGELVIDSIDYDGRFILAQFLSGGIWVIDTSDGSSRQVATGATIRFG